MMDNLHGVLRALHPERKSDSAKPIADHLSVFREFISHLDRMARQPKPARPKAPRVMKRKAKR